MLDSHPAVCGAPEFLYVPDVMELRKKLHEGIARGWIDLLCSREDVDRSLCLMLENLLLPLADRGGFRLLSEKSPQNVLVFSDLLEICAASRFLHVVRDPRAVVASLLQVGRRAEQMGDEARKRGLVQPDFTRNVAAAVEFVKRCVEAGDKAARAAPGRVHTVVYERLVTDPESETKRICDFLGIEWAPEMLHPGKVKHPGEKAIVNEVWYDAKAYNRDPETRQMNKWRNQLTQAQQVAVSISFADFEPLAGYGYDFSLDQNSLIGRVGGATAVRVGQLRKETWKILKGFARGVPGLRRVARPILSLVRGR